jgi:hypothetical protein
VARLRGQSGHVFGRRRPSHSGGLHPPRHKRPRSLLFHSGLSGQTLPDRVFSVRVRPGRPT